jgi:hypothetical protein
MNSPAEAAFLCDATSQGCEAFRLDQVTHSKAVQSGRGGEFLAAALQERVPSFIVIDFQASKQHFVLYGLKQRASTPEREFALGTGRRLELRLSVLVSILLHVHILPVSIFHNQNLLSNLKTRRAQSKGQGSREMTSRVGRVPLDMFEQRFRGKAPFLFSPFILKHWPLLNALKGFVIGPDVQQHLW